MKTICYILLLLLLLAGVSCEQEEVHSTELNMTMKEQYFEHPDCMTAEGPCVTIQLIYPRFSGQGALPQRLNAWVENYIYQPEADTTALAPEQLAEGWFNDYNRYTETIEEYSISWTLERRVELVFQSPRIISLHFNEFSFTGGAHPTQLDYFRSFEKPDGHKITLDNLTYDSIQFERFLSMAEEEFRYSYELFENEMLEDGYWFTNGEFYLPDNFAFTDFGILFYFNSYEITPYTVGPIAIELSYEDVESLIRASWMKIQEQLTLR